MYEKDYVVSFKINEDRGTLLVSASLWRMHFNHHYVMKSMDHFNECVDLYLAAPHRELPTPGRTSICGNLFSFNVSRPRTVGLGLYGFGGQNDKVVQSLFLLVSI